ncbi:MAG TPA: multidrug effflux MFS transporter [Cellvibrionaceae bacterium]|nr:multidrug effflux MFS transporter [Cellvibrionaceae bacterium]
MTVSTHTASASITRGEFTVLIALLMSIIAISIDALLPALGIIRSELKLVDANQVQLLITAIFLGMTGGQLIAGPVSDALGRKPILYLGLALYFVGSLICYIGQDLPQLLLGRLIQGLGVSGPYVAAMSIVRDKYSGEQMAKIMSIVMLIFMGVPAIAPSLGQGILLLADWRSIFIFYIGYALLIGGWIFLRLEETLPKPKRIGLSATHFSAGFKEVVGNKISMGYTLCMGCIFGSLIGYLNSAQQIFQELYATGHLFTLYFGLLALIFGGASLGNAYLVEHLGMRRLCDLALRCMVVTAVIFLAVEQWLSPPLWMFMLFAGINFLCFGFIFGNSNAIAMEPMGHIAGMASAIIGAVSSAISLVLGTCIGLAYNNSLQPVTLGFLLLCSAAWLAMRYANRSY